MGWGEGLEPADEYPVLLWVAGVLLDVELDAQSPELQVQGPGALAVACEVGVVSLLAAPCLLRRRTFTSFTNSPVVGSEAG